MVSRRRSPLTAYRLPPTTSRSPLTAYGLQHRTSHNLRTEIPRGVSHCESLGLIILLLTCGALSAGHLSSGLDFVLRSNPIDTMSHSEVTPFTFREPNELTLAATGAIRLYQIFVSSQDMPVCNFTPSCSRFGMAAIKRYGLVVGCLMTADRLLRCNGLNHEYYPPHPETGKCYDPPEAEMPWRR